MKATVGVVCLLSAVHLCWRPHHSARGFASHGQSKLNTTKIKNPIFRGSMGVQVHAPPGTKKKATGVGHQDTFLAS